MIKETVAVEYYPKEEINLNELIYDLSDHFINIPEESRAEATVRVYKQEKSISKEIDLDTYTSFIISYPREFTAEEQEQYNRILKREEKFKNNIKFDMYKK